MKFVFVNKHGTKTVDFANSEAVLQLNKALLKHHYQHKDWNIPEHYLCPPVPGRADYIHYISDLLADDGITKNIRGLDIGVGANAIYPILGSQIYNWHMVGADTDPNAIAAAQSNIEASEPLKRNVEIRHQKKHANIFEGIINPGEYFQFSMCNPPFYSSKESATKSNLRKLRNLAQKDGKASTFKEITLNFGGQANELWCNGGEALFIKRMIKQSVGYKKQIGWFTSLVSKKENLPKIYKQLNKLKADHKTIEMTQGNKQSRFVAWRFEQ